MSAEAARGRKALEQWRSMSSCDAKLARLLREGASTAVLAKAIQVRADGGGGVGGRHDAEAVAASARLSAGRWRRKSCSTSK